MKVTMHVGWLVFFSLLLIAITYFVTDYFNEPNDTVTINKKRDYDIVTFKLPNTHDPEIFGPEYWKARHALAEMTPCPACQIEAVSHEKMFHDYVNRKKGKKMMYPENFNRWVKKLSEKV